MTHDGFFPCPGCGDSLPRVSRSDSMLMLTCSCRAMTTRGRGDGQDWCVELLDEGHGSLAAAAVHGDGSVTGVVCYPESGLEFPADRLEAVGLLFKLVAVRAVMGS